MAATPIIILQHPKENGMIGMRSEHKTLCESHCLRCGRIKFHVFWNLNQNIRSVFLNSKNHPRMKATLNRNLVFNLHPIDLNALSIHQCHLLYTYFV